MEMVIQVLKVDSEVTEEILLLAAANWKGGPELLHLYPSLGGSGHFSLGLLFTAAQKTFTVPSFSIFYLTRWVPTIHLAKMSWLR